MLDAISPEKRLNFCERQLNQKRQVKLKTCADVYEHWRSYKRLYRKAPSDGVEFQIDYIDTGLAMSDEERARAPIALALHGAPGSYHDFSLLINHLAAQRVRVIAPNFPEYIATVKTKVLFRHSADEKAAYLRDFLKAIDVKTIDLLVSHSSAIFPTLLILLNANNQAIARQNDEQKRQASAVVETEKRKRRTADARVRLTLDSSADVRGRQPDEKVVSQLRATEQAGSSNGSELDDNTDADSLNSESFEDAVDAVDAIDNNNNNRHILAESARANSETCGQDDELVIKLKQLNANGELIGESCAHEAARQEVDEAKPKRLAATRRAARQVRRQHKAVVVKFDEPIEIKAVALFNPAGHRLPKSMKPTWFKCGSVHVYQHKLGRSLFRKFGPGFLTIVGVPVRVDNMDNVMLSATVMRNAKCQRVVEQLDQLSQMKIPTLLVFSENDKLIEKEIFYEMTQFMHLDPKKFDVFNNDGDIELSQSTMNDWIRVMVFKAGGHYAYSNYAKTVNRAVSELLARVRPDRTSETPQ